MRRYFEIYERTATSLQDLYHTTEIVLYGNPNLESD